MGFGVFVNVYLLPGDRARLDALALAMGKGRGPAIRRLLDEHDGKTHALAARLRPALAAAREARTLGEWRAAVRAIETAAALQ